MTPQERDLLDRFLSDLQTARPGPKDAEAADRIDRALRANPDAAYVLVQHAILSDGALQDAQARIAELEERLGPPQGGGSFLGGGYGQAGYGQPGYGQPGYGPAGGYPPPPIGTAVPPTGGGGMFGGGPFGGGGGPFSGGGGLGGFLRTAGTTAAGVAGGAFLFEGLSGLFGGHHGGGGGYGFGFGGGDNVTINEFDGGDDGGRQGFADGGDLSDAGGGPDFDYDNG